ncbi:hypothetical protein BJX76DRAFT_357927 [Aspergillus varians]
MAAMEDQNRRYACDRCRGHKLRCERMRGYGDTSPCKRCLKARAECITSPSLRTGRPSLSENRNSPSITSGRKGRGSAKSMVREDSNKSVPPPPSLPPPEILDPQQDSLDSIMHWSRISPRGDYRPDDASINLLESAGLPSPGLFLDPETSHGDPLGMFDLRPLFSPEENSGPSMPDLSLPRTAAPGSSRETGSSSGTLVSDYSSITHPVTAPSALDAKRQELLQNLSDLSASLLHDLKRVSDPPPDPADAYGSTPSTQSSASMLRNVNVGRLLEQSERFIDILQHAVRPSSTDRSQLHGSTPLPSGIRYFDLNNPLNAPSESCNNTFPTTLSQLLGDGLSPSSITSPSPFNYPGGTGQSSTPPTTLIRLDVPTMFAVLSCYTSLLRIYEAVFSHIHASLRVSNSVRQRLLPPLPGLHLCGFKLEKHQNLQLEILARVSLHMLNRLEKMLDDISRAGVNSGVLEESNAALLLKLVTKPGSEAGGAGDGVSLRDIRKSIRELLEVKLAFP